MACEWLANAQAHNAGLAMAEATLDRCQALFPDHARRKDLLEQFQKRAEGLP
jgi:hypothetical protein